MTIFISPEVEKQAARILEPKGLDVNGYLQISLEKLIEQEDLPFPLETEESFYQLKPEVQQSIIEADKQLDELPTFKTVEEMEAWLDAQDEEC